MNPFGIMKLKEFAKLMGVPESTIRTWKLRQDIPSTCFKIIGGSVFVKLKEIEAFFAA